ncbi:hypothetical protein D3C72_1448430 [compost metagenome]
MVIVLIVGAMVCLLAGFSYVFLWSRRPDLWQAPPAISSLMASVGLLVVAGLCAVTAPRVVRMARAGSVSAAAGLLVLACVAAIAAMILEGRAWWATGLRPEASSQGASVYALLSWAGTFAVIGGLMGLYVVLRRLFGRLVPERPSTVDLISLFLAFTAAQAIGVILLVCLFPGGGT